MASIQKQVRNMKLHMPYIKALGYLKNASPELVQALATAIRLLNEQGVKFPRAHQRRARRMMSRNVSRKTKKELVSGKPGTKSRGGGFFGGIGKWFHKAGETIKASADKTGKTLGKAARSAGDWVKGAAEKAAPYLEEAGQFALEHPEILEALAA